jgi:beta-N-acetylhexosaminidase
VRFVLVLTLALAWAPRLAPAAVVGQGAPDIRVDRLLAHMTLAQKVGQMFMFSFDGTSADPEVLRLVRDWGAGGLILYRPNVVSAPQLRALIAHAQRAARVPLLIATDEEGGPSTSMIPFSIGVHTLLAPQQYGQLNSPARVYADALAAGRDLRALGVTMDLAPVLDVLSDPHSPIGARSYGRDPALVARLGTAAIRGYQKAGIAATAKHFLGLGGVSLDAHLARPTVRRSLRQLERIELVPMRAAIRAGVDALMVTHTVIPALDPSGTPASLSRRIITGYSRGTLGYRGLIISDTLPMGAIDAYMSIPAAAARAAAAGDDIVLVAYYQGLPPATMHAALEAVLHAVETGRISTATVDAAARHVLLLKAKLGLL